MVTASQLRRWTTSASLHRSREGIYFFPPKKQRHAYFLADNLLFYINAGFFHKYLVFNLGIEGILTELEIKYFRYIYIF